MGNPAPSLIGEELRGLDLIESLVRKQQALVREFRAALGDDANELTLRACAPGSVHALDETWSVAVHGVGVRFTNAKTGEAIDVHVGVFESDRAFDAWRLEEHAESIHAKPRRFEPIIEQLASKGVVRRHKTLANHYELLNDQEM
jgi:hypothetical protein